MIDKGWVRGSGIGRMPGWVERLDRQIILTNYAERVKRNKGNHPGTHTLGTEFDTRKEY